MAAQAQILASDSAQIGCGWVVLLRERVCACIFTFKCSRGLKLSFHLRVNEISFCCVLVVLAFCRCVVMWLFTCPRMLCKMGIRCTVGVLTCSSCIFALWE